MFRTLTPIFSIVIAVTVFFTITQPLFGDIRLLEDEAKEYEDAIGRAEGLNASLQNLSAQKNAFSASELQRLEALVPDDVNEVRLLIDLEGIAKQYGMFVSEVSVDENKSVLPDGVKKEDDSMSYEEDFSSLDITLGLIGTYEQFRDVLADMERSLSLVEIVDLSFRVSGTDLQEYTLTLRANALIPLMQQ